MVSCFSPLVVYQDLYFIHDHVYIYIYIYISKVNIHKHQNPKGDFRPIYFSGRALYLAHLDSHTCTVCICILNIHVLYTEHTCPVYCTYMYLCIVHICTLCTYVLYICVQYVHVYLCTVYTVTVYCTYMYSRYMCTYVQYIL